MLSTECCLFNEILLCYDMNGSECLINGAADYRRVIN